jgi:hypothetical protein
MTRRWVAVCVVALMMVGAVQSHAQEAKKEEKKDPKAAKVDGTWKWSFTRQNGQTMESTLKLKREGEKLTGAVVGRQGRETAIGDARIAADGTISFTVTREFNGNSFTQKYEGKVEGDTIKGKISGERQGQAFSRDWEAKRAADAGGTWRLERTLDNGQTFTATLRLKQEGEKVTGTTQWADREPVEIEEGKIEGSKLTFQVTRENDGQKWTAKYDAEVTADAIKGTVTAGNDQGEERSWEMEYTRVKE